MSERRDVQALEAPERGIRPRRRVRPPARWEALELRELWSYRALWWALASRDVKVRYKQTALGVIWVVLQPLLGAGILAFVFGTVAGLPSEGVPYLVFSFAGLLGWNVFSQVLSQSSNSLVASAPLISKVYFPRLILPFSTIYSALIDFCVGFAVFAVLLFAYGLAPGPEILLLPLWLLLLLLLALGGGLFFGSLMVPYRDVRYVLPIAIQFLLYGSPVAYGLALLDERVPAAWRDIYMLNPLASLLEACRWSLLGNSHIQVSYLAYSIATTLALFVVGVLFFKRQERRFADVI